MDDSHLTSEPTEARASAPIGLTFASFSALGPAVGMHAAARATELGYSSFWVAETVGMEAFATLAAIGAAQPTLSLGTGVLALQLRTPAVTAMGAATLQALHPDRDILLGVGISSPAVVNRWHGATYGTRPLAQTR
jgi:alkanesulfonate monooxygenase SsuD/methylene tetrahydromethanopterin reductase-like flavin-dependent oxidoreductase (luciferase family)